MLLNHGFDTNALDALESSLNEEPLFFVEPTDRDPATEVRRVAAFRSAMRSRAPQVMIAAVPNSQVTQKAKNQAKREGAYWGFPDMICLAPGGLAAFLEWKAGRTIPAGHQIDAMNRLHRLGFAVGVFRRPATAVRFLKERGFPIGEPVL